MTALPARKNRTIVIHGLSRAQYETARVVAEVLHQFFCMLATYFVYFVVLHVWHLYYTTLVGRLYIPRALVERPRQGSRFTFPRL